MHHRLKEILEQKREEIRELGRKGLRETRDDGMPRRRDFRKAISAPGRIRLIAEIKFASPSEGMIRERVEPSAIGRIYEGAGAAAISLVTDTRFFGGRIEDLPRLRKAVSLPVLRKDFIIDPIQVKESYMYGADAILLIARILSKEQLGELLTLSTESGLTPLTEVHDPHDLEKALECGAETIGINNRNLDTFEVSLQTTVDLASRIPGSCVMVSESGIARVEDIRCLRKAGVHAFLIGTSIMKSDDMRGRIEDLLEAGNQEGAP